jgi:hypothetical protein
MPKTRTQGRKVARVDLNPLKIYPSVLAAAKDLGLNYSGLYYAVRASRYFHGLWQFIDVKTKSHAIRCVETGETFTSAYAAGTTYGVRSGSIIHSARTGAAVRTAGDKHFEFVKPCES